ncbi:MAG: ATP-dependent Clp protease ATP-binding subunit, partial [Chloroflexi bacterium]|nr:ATP-dependent Clp protease ATP-binding subunit [Chloroflexota bacterium]
MAKMLERLSPAARTSFDTAKNQARTRKSEHLDTTYLMLGLLQTQKNLCREVFKVQDQDLDRLEKALLDLAPVRDEAPARLKVSPGVKDVLRESQNLAGDGAVQPTHLLTAILTADKTITDVLDKAGVSSAEALQALQERQVEPEPVPVESPRASMTPTLDQYGRDLTALAHEGKLSPIVGRERETMAMLEVLCRPQKNNPILVGQPGVGKTAIVEGLAQRLARDEVPPLMQGRRIVELSLSALVAGARAYGEFEARVQAIVKEVKAAGNVIIFVDEAHALIGAGGAPGVGDAATILKPALARGDLHCIAATTLHDYRKYIEKDGALARRFQPVRVEEPGQDMTLDILATLRPLLAEHFGVDIPAPLLVDVYELSRDYLRNRCFPDKAIDLLERAAARAMLQTPADQPRVVMRQHLLSVLAEITGLPLADAALDEAARYRELDRFLADRAVGQDEAAAAVSRVVRLAKLRLDLQPTRPDGVFAFVGPSDTSKNEMARALAEFLFGEADRLIELDMAEFSEAHTVARLIGSPPGYVGYDEEGQLTGQVAARPFCVVLVHDVDKAHPAVLQLLAQICDDGRLTDGQGRTVSFSDATVILTTNLGVETDRRAVGFTGVGPTGHTTDDVRSLLREHLSPDLA